MQHSLEEGFIEPGETCIDPFGGVSLGALPCLLHGINIVHCELEPKFHELAKANLAPCLKDPKTPSLTCEKGTNSMQDTQQETQQDTQWLAQLHLGDKVIVMLRNGATCGGQVARMTTTQILLFDRPGATRYSRRTGWAIGGSLYDKSYLCPWTPEAQEAVDRHAAQQWLRLTMRSIPNTAFAQLSLTQCQHLKQVLADYGLIEQTKGPTMQQEVICPGGE